MKRTWEAVMLKSLLSLLNTRLLLILRFFSFGAPAIVTIVIVIIIIIIIIELQKGLRSYQVAVVITRDWNHMIRRQLTAILS